MSRIIGLKKVMQISSIFRMWGGSPSGKLCRVATLVLLTLQNPIMHGKRMLHITLYLPYTKGMICRKLQN